MRCYGYVRNTAAQLVSFGEADLSNISSKVFYLGDATINQDLWVDGFSIAFTGKRARRAPKQALLALALAGASLKKVGIPFPMDMGRYFRMTTSSDIDLSETFSIVGRPTITMQNGVDETVRWLKEEFQSEKL